MDTKDLVTAIMANKSSDIQAAFDAAMNDRLVQVIGAYREEVTREVFGESIDDSVDQPTSDETE